MFRLLFAAARSRVVWFGLGIATAGAAFVFTVALSTAVAIVVLGDDMDPDVVSEVAAPRIARGRGCVGRDCDGLACCASSATPGGPHWGATGRRGRRPCQLSGGNLVSV